MQSNAEDRSVSLWHIGDLFRLDGPGGALLNSLHDGVYVADESDTILFWNRAAESVTGYTADQIVGRECGSNLFVSSTMPYHADAGSGDAMWFGGPGTSGRVEKKYVVHKTGRRVPVKLNASPISDGIGGVAGALVVFWDVSTATEDDASSQASRVNELLQHYVSRETFEMAKLHSRAGRMPYGVPSPK
jgi:PAS domain S-box-containing protein